MNRESTKRLKLDRRLIHRRGWISKAELDGALEALPDLTDKILPPDDESDAASGEAGSATDPPRVE